LITVDASALIAIAFEEPEESQFITALARASEAHISPVNYLETGLILLRRRRFASRPQFETWLADMGVTLREDLSLGGEALATYLRFGKGFHRARLNLADCFAYALAKRLDVPLLYKGDDFAKTDIRSALHPT
jgi:ribonuclease VapC